MIRHLLTKLYVVLLLLVPLGAIAQNVITGKIIDKEDRQPIASAAIKIKETDVGTSSDVVGRFTLEVNPGQAIVISAPGYLPQQFSVGNAKVFNISLIPTEEVQGEMVITALGIKKDRRSLVYGQSEVQNDLIENKEDIAEALNGKVAGLQVTSSGGGAGSSTNITMRGTSSITGNNQALFVVDGVPIDNSTLGTESTIAGVSYSNRAIDINPEDVETVTVLKGGSAIALYGLQGSNGVILITTKKGQKGKMRIDLSSSVGFDQVSRLPYFQNLYVQGSGGLYTPPDNNPSPKSWGPKITTMRYDGNKDYPFDKNGKIVPQGDPTETPKVPLPYDNVGKFFRTGETFTNYIAFSGGTESSTFRVSLGSERQNSIVPTDYFKRINMKLSGETEVMSHLKLSSNLNFINSGGRRAQQGSSAQSAILGLYRTPISFDNSNGLSNAGDVAQYTLPDGSQRTYRGENGGFNNPYFTINEDPFVDDVNRMIGNMTLNYTPLPWLGLNYILGGDVYSDERTQKYEVNDAGYPNGAVIEDNYLSKIVNSDFQLLIKKHLSSDVGMNLILGNTYYSNFLNERNTTGTNLNFPGFLTIANAQSTTAFSKLSQYHVVSYYASLDLNWRHDFYLNASYRYDKSTLLDPAKNSFSSPSVGIAWAISELPFLKDNSFLDYAKLRASVGTSGNEPPLYSLYDTYSQVNFNTSNTNGSYDGFTNGLTYPFNGTGGFINSSTLGNPHLKAEQTKEYDFGAELDFLKDRITLDLTYYEKMGSNLIIQVPFASSTGFGAQVLNSASMTNKGFEVMMNIIPAKTRNFDWTIHANFTKNVNKVTDLAVQSVSYGGFSGITVAAIKGYANTSFFGPTFLTDGKGHQLIEDNAADPNGTVGYPIAGTQSSYVGNPNPNWTMGITNVIRYKQWRLAGLLDIKNGGQVWNGTEGALVSYGRADVTLNRNQNTVFPGVLGHLDAGGNPVVTGGTNAASVPLNEAWYSTGNGGGFGAVSSQFVQPAGWVRLRELSLSYKINPKVFKKGPIRSVELGAYGRNLWLQTKYHGIDPETSLQGAGNSQGLDYFQLPGTKTYGFNLKVSL